MQSKEKPKESLSTQDWEFLDESKKSFLLESPRWVNVMLYTIVAFILVFIIWAKFAVLDEVTVGEGKVIPSSQVQVIQNLEGGIVLKIYVKEGQLVEKGEILMRLDDTQFASSYEQGKAKYLALLASTARLRAEDSGATYIDFPEEVVKQAPSLVASETNLFTQHMEQLNAQLKTLQESYALAQKEYNITKPLVDEGLMSQLDLIRLNRDINDTNGKIEQAKEDFQSKAHNEFNEQSAQLTQLAEALRGLQDRLTRTTIRSPVKGTVKKINVATIGGVIQPGMEIMQIVPSEDTLLIEAKIRPQDIAFIRPDQKAMVKFTAYDFSIYGGLEGRVEYISADTIEEKSNDGRGNLSFYKILVRTDKNYLGTTNKPLPIIPGMVCTVDILTGTKTVLDYMLKPIFKARTEALKER